MHLLIVDDSSADRSLISYQLRQHLGPFQLTEAATLADFQAALVHGPFDAVVTDHKLAWGDGLQVMREVQKRFPGTPVIMCTDSGNEQVVVEGMRTGLSDYVLKRRLEHLPAAVLTGMERAELQSKYDELEARVAERTAELAQAQATAEQRANELNAVFAALTDAITVFDREGRIVRYNPAAEAFTGPDPAREERQDRVRRLACRPAGDRKLFTVQELPSSRALGGETVVDEQIVLTQADGRQRVLLVSASPLRHDGKVVGAVTAAHDITELEQARELSETLMQINMRLGSTLEIDPIMPEIIAQAAQALRADVAALNRRESGGWLVHHVYGLPPGVSDRFYSDEEALIAAEVARRRDVLVIEDCAADAHLGADAQAHDVHAYIAIPLLQEGEMAGIIYFGYHRPQPITTAQLYFARQLAALVSLALEAGHLYEQARQDADTKAILLREVNHRVKNNLAAIVGLIYTHLERPAIAASPEYRVLVHELAQRVESLSIVHGMLSASRWSSLLLDELAERIIVSSLQVVGPGWLKVEVKSSPVRVSPDQAHTLALVINELAMNIVKHALRDQPCHVVLQVAREEQTVVLTVRDDGPGYPAEVLREQRLGVGLDLTRNLVRQNLRGRLVLRNEGGAVAEVHFPPA